MSSLVKQKNRPFWYCRFRGADGTEHTRSTKTTSRKAARIICAQWEEAAQLGRRNKLTPDRARRVIEEGVAKLVEQCGEALPNSTIRAFLHCWLSEKKSAAAEGTYSRYEGIIRRFLEHLGARADESLASLSKRDVLEFRDALAGRVSRGTVNTYLKVLRVALGRAVREEILLKNPAALVDKMTTGDRQSRRAFTLPELRKLMAGATQDWRTMIMLSLYSGGQRLGDVANLRWSNLDTVARELTLVTSKTGRTIILPLAGPLLSYLETLEAGDDPKAPLCPALAGQPESWLSNQFYELMASVGLVSSRSVHNAEREDYRGPKKGRHSRRKLSEISFHSLRHTATTLLKNEGVSDAVARDIVGHDSVAVSRSYTHIDQETKRAALAKLPDLLAEVPAPSRPPAHANV